MDMIIDENAFKEGERFVGILVQLVKNYGFISAVMGVVFLPPREYVKPGQKFVVGSCITFTLSKNSKGFVATNCTINEARIYKPSTVFIMDNGNEFKEDSANTSKVLINKDYNDEGLVLPPFFSAPFPSVDTTQDTSHIGDGSSGFFNSKVGVFNQAIKLVSSMLKPDITHNDQTLGKEYDKKPQNPPCPSICSSDRSADNAAAHGPVVVDPSTWFSMPVDISSEDIEAFATFSRQYRSLRDSPLASVATELTNTFIQEQQQHTFPADLLSNTRKGDAAFAEQIVQNYSNAFTVLMERYRNGLRYITKDFIKDLHANVCRGMCSTAGKFRSKPVRVGKQRFVKVAQVDTAVDDFCIEVGDPGDGDSWDNDQWEIDFSAIDPLQSLFAAAHPCVKAAYTAYRFCHIHPFEDGNGRTARLLANFILTSEVPFPISFCSSPADRKKYIAAFRSASPALLTGHFMDCTLRTWRKFFQQFTDRVLEQTLKSPPITSSVVSAAAGSQHHGVSGKELELADPLSSSSSSMKKSDVAAEKAADSSESHHLILHKARALLRLENCVICFEKDSDLSLLCCGMPFHAHCIFQWMSVSQNRVEDGAHCPQCRHTIDMQGLRLYTSATKQDSSEEDDDDDDEEESEEVDTNTSEDESEDDEEDTTTSDNEIGSQEGTPICKRCNNIRSRDCINRCCGNCCGDSYLDLSCLKHSR